MSSYIKARPTIYKGIQMRSRLEARFAKWLDDNQTVVSWEYEPDCYADQTGEYLPDFVALETDHTGTAAPIKFYIEVKPHVADLDAALRRMHIIRATEPTAPLTVMVGNQAGTRFDMGPHCSPWNQCHDCKPAPPKIEWTQLQADGMFDMIVELKKQRAQLDTHLTRINEWVDGLVSESRCAIGTPEWLTAAIEARPRTIRVDNQ